MEASPHRIRSLRWQVHAASQEEAFALRKRLRDDLHPVLLPAVARAFDEAGPVDGVLRIPKIELRLEIAEADDLAGLLAELTRLRLSELLGTMTQGTAPAGKPSLGFTRVSAEEDRLQSLARYLKTGDLPWPNAGLGRTAIVEELRLAAVRDPASLLDLPMRLETRREERVAFYFRLLQLLPDEEWEPVAAAVAARNPGALSEAVAALAEARSVSRYLRLKAAAMILAAVGTSEEESITILGEVENLIVLLPGPVSTGLRRWLEGGALTPGPSPGRTPGPAGEGSVPAPASSPSGAPPLPEVSTGTKRRRSKAGRDSTLPSPEKSGSIGTAFDSVEGAGSLSREAGEGRGGGSGASQKAPSPTLPRADARERESLPPIRHREQAPVANGSEDQDERTLGILDEKALHSRLRLLPDLDAEPGTFPLAVRHAGLILLHPFLPRFFESTGVREPGQVELDPAVLPRTAALLHLLATGEEEPYELELGLIKILLGLKPGEPLPVSGGLLRERDREEAEALLQAVIGHWSVLKKTSIHGLRQTFLQRNGLLREEDQGFLLQVEPESFDVLLGHLPWGIGTVKLPWMTKPIFTDWPRP